MTRFACLLLFATVAVPVAAQEPPPRIGPYVVDLHGSVPRFPSDQTLADSRGMLATELPGHGFGLQVGASVYLFRWKAVTFGIGGEYLSSRARSEPPESRATMIRAAEERFRSLGTQLSFNFGTGHGWSYISGGIGQSTWSLVPADRDPFPTDSEHLKTVNYGGGARWFAKTHLAFSFDVRFYAINPGSAYLDYPHSPRTTMLVIGAGVSVK
jgi:hypothetical protein